ncbi:MAG: VWA domain-containing protein [Myxococcales bacterium]|nr:VWA domain-containing protein [Myxococcales bacterium]
MSRLTGPITDGAALAAAAGFVSVALTLLYLLRPRRRQVEVPYAGLWRRVLAEHEMRTIGGRWRRLASWALFLGVAALLIGALAEPMWRHEPTAAERQARLHHIVIGIDTSASTATRDGPPAAGQTAPRRRIDAACERVRSRLEGARPDERFLLLAASGAARVIGGWGTGAAALDLLAAALGPAADVAAAGLNPTASACDPARALAMADLALTGRGHTSVLWVTDGGPDGVVQTRTPAGHPIEVVRAGPLPAAAPGLADLADLAIGSVRLRANPGDPGRTMLIAHVDNRSARPHAARLVIATSAAAQNGDEFAADASTRRVLLITLPPGTSRHEMPDLDVSAPRVAVRVESADRTLVDVAPWNDWGFAVMAERRRLRVLVAGPTHALLGAALAANPRLDVIEAPPGPPDAARWTRALQGSGAPDVVVWHAMAVPPPADLPALWISFEPPADATATARFARGPEVVPRDAGHAAMRGVSFQDTNFDNVRVLGARAGDVVLADARGAGPVMVARAGPPPRIEWGIDLDATDLPLRYAMPILIDNALGWLAGDAGGQIVPLQPGRPWSIAVPAGGRGWQWREPGRPPRPARLAGDRVVGSSEVHGIHTFTADDGRTVARPTQLAASENPARLAPASVGALPVARPASSPDAGTGRWAWLVLAGLGLLLLEWPAYLRRRTL